MEMKQENTKARRTRRGPRAALIGAGAAAALILAAGLLLFWHNRFGFERDALLAAARQEDSLLLFWPQVEGADSYYVRASSEDQENFYEGWVQGTGCGLSLPQSGILTVRIQPARQGNKGAAREWQIQTGQEADWPSLTGFEAAVQMEGDGIRFHWSGTGGEVFLLYQMGENGLYRLAAQTGDTTWALPLGGEGEQPLPGYEETLEFAGGIARQDGSVLYGSSLSQPVTFRRSDFLGRDIQLRAAQDGENTYTFQWNEAQGEGYLVQYCSDDVTQWTGLARVEPSEQPSCRLKLASGTNYRLRVVGVAEGDWTGENALSQSQELTLTTGLSVEFATVWPIQDLDIYGDTGRQEVIGTACAASAYCVLEETGDLFRIRTGDGDGYIDSSLCLINLPDYLGELCAYNITNSYDSLYMVHGYEIPGMTGTVITGYENVQVAEGRYLVPLLYPSARKLAAAAQSTLADGYRIKIYDAYRPRAASTEIYQVASAHLEDPIPDTTYSGEPVDDLPVGIPLLSELEARKAAAQTQPAASQAEPSAAENSWPAAEAEPASSVPAETASSEVAPAETETVSPGAEAPAASSEPAEEAQPERYLTYHILMTNGGYHLGSFLARNGSTHNLGIAMDLTLERVDTREELEMQTAIHDLSHYSVVQRNNESAELLAVYMMDAGFAPLATEWWHFQDDDTRDTLGLATYQEQGVSLEGWHRDLNGWYYCQADGGRVRNQDLTLEGRTYRFDGEGYAAEIQA